MLFVLVANIELEAGWDEMAGCDIDVMEGVGGIRDLEGVVDGAVLAVVDAHALSWVLVGVDSGRVDGDEAKTMG